jgi:hypothetical protein
MEQYPNLAPCTLPHNDSTRAYRSMALAWRNQRAPHLVLVQESFVNLGYKTLIGHCKDAGGFDITREVLPSERPLIDLLECAARQILSGFVIDFPTCRIIYNETAIVMGTAQTHKRPNSEYNASGRKIRYNVEKINLQSSLLTKHSFMTALSVYCHELCHCFGGDASRPFSAALTDVMGLMIANADRLAQFKTEWLNYFDDNGETQNEA